MSQDNMTQTKADRVFRNAKVYSVAFDNTVTRAEAVAVRDGKIVYVGTDEGVLPFIGDTTEVTDCKGNTLLPGFGDGHMHLGVCERRYGGVILYDLMTDYKEPEFYVKEIQRRIKAYADAHPNAKAVLGSGWDRAWFDGSVGFPARPLTRKDLDAAVPDKPVILDSFCGHVCIVNSKALEEAGLLRTGVEQIQGGLIRIGEDGIPDGYLQETAAINGFKELCKSSSWTKEDRHAAVKACIAEMAEQGLTIGTDYLYNKESYEVISQMGKDGELTLRVSGSFLFNNTTAEQDLAYAVEHRHAYDVDDLVKVDAAKFFIDGDFGLFEPYTPKACKDNGWEEGYCGEILWDEENFRKTAASAQKAGFHLHAHAMGDRAVAISANAFKAAQEEADPGKTKRNVVIHIALIRDEEKKLMGESGVIASVQPLWHGVSENGNEQERTYFGDKRYTGLYPCNTLINHGVTVAFGSDFPVYPLDTFGSIQTAIARKITPHDLQYELCKNDPVVNTAECTSLQNAVKAGTINVAYELGLENVTGSIELNKSAELVLIDCDLENTPVDQFYKIKVLETVFKGKTVYKAE